MKLDLNAKYQTSHEWVRPDGDQMVCGISDYAQNSLSDVVFIELPDVGKLLKQGDVFGTIESVKAASDLYMPLSGEIVEVNEAISDALQIINNDPYNKGWLIKFKPTNMVEWDKLLSGKDYKKAVEAEG